MRLLNRARVPVIFAVIALLAGACTSRAHRTGAASSSAASSGAASTMSSGSASTATSQPPATHASGSAGHSPSASASAPSASSAANPSAGPAGRVSAARPCGMGGSAHYSHVVWIWMENKAYGSVIGSSSAPYENALARQCGLATNYHGVTHPSLPNYIAATAGSTFGIADDAGPAAHQLSADSIFSQLSRAGSSWRSYEESMPLACGQSPSGEYAVKHNPAAYFTSIRAACQADDVPLGGNLDRDVAAGTLPSFAFVTPNLCNDTHDCSVRTGDAWLSSWIPRILNGPNYRAGNTLVVLTWDEGVGSSNQMPTIVVGPSVPAGTVAGQRFDHYALLRTTEDLLGVGRLGNAAGAPSMAAAFGL